MGMMEVERFVLSAYEIAMAKEVRTVNSGGLGFRGWKDDDHDDDDDDDDDDDEDDDDTVFVRVTVIALGDEGKAMVGGEVDVRAIPTMNESTFPGASELQRRKKIKTRIPVSH